MKKFMVAYFQSPTTKRYNIKKLIITAKAVFYYHYNSMDYKTNHFHNS